MSIRITTTQAIDAMLAREREYITEVLAVVVEGLTPEDCNHRNGGPLEKCTRCAQRIAITEAAAKIRETGGVK